MLYSVKPEKNSPNFKPRLSFQKYLYIKSLNDMTSCRKLYSFVVYLYVNGSGSITSVGEERANLSAVVYL